jgi:hypothetical protein
MSQTTPDSATRRSRTRAKDLSAPQLRAVRKELLLMRADVERAELARTVMDMRESVSSFRWLKLLVPGFGFARSGRSGKGMNAILSELVTQHPLISSLVSMVLAKPLRGALRATAKPALKWGGLGLALWEAYRIWRQIKEGQGEDANDGMESPS